MKMKTIVAAVALSALCAGTSLAAGWQQDSKGWWWQFSDGSGYPKGTWMWADGNGDGSAECYYFDQNGYCLMNTITPDGYTVNANGAWIVNGAVQTKKVGSMQPQSDVQQKALSDLYSGKYVYQYNINDFGKWKAYPGTVTTTINVVKQDADHVLIDGELYTRMSNDNYKGETFGRQTNSIYDGYIEYYTFEPSQKMVILHGEEEGDLYYLMR